VSTSNAPNSSDSLRSFLRLALSGEAGLLLLAWGLSRWLQVTPLASFRPNLRSLLWGLAATVPLLLVLYGMMSSRAGPARRLVDLVVDQLGPLVARQSTAALGTLALVAGFSEEVLFRGVIQTGITRCWSATAAVMTTSLLFGLVHFASRTYAIFAAIMGVYLGALFQLTGDLFAPIVTHAVYDLVALVWVARRYQAQVNLA
jgi:membrane protease YdiL (CAAX protease family)